MRTPDKLLGVLTDALAETHAPVEYLGRGGMSVLFKAYHKGLNQWHAVKVLGGNAAVVSEAGRHRFKEEARKIARLRHPHIRRVHDIRELPSEGVLFMVMEYVDGQSLDKMLKTGPLGLDHGLRVSRQVADALAHAHANGIIHRDIKPGNVLLDADGEAYLADFGIAKSADDPDLTRDFIPGTEIYLAPELFDKTAAGVRSDLFALGCLFYATLVGRQPFTHAGQALHARLDAGADIGFKRPSEIKPGVPHELDTLLVELVSTDPNRRPPSCEAVTKRLDAIIETGGAGVGAIGRGDVPAGDDDAPATAVEPSATRVPGSPPLPRVPEASPGPSPGPSPGSAGAEGRASLPKPRFKKPAFDPSMEEAGRGGLSRAVWISISAVVLVVGLSLGAHALWRWFDTPRPGPSEIAKTVDPDEPAARTREVSQVEASDDPVSSRTPEHTERDAGEEGDGPAGRAGDAGEEPRRAADPPRTEASKPPRESETRPGGSGSVVTPPPPGSAAREVTLEVRVTGLSGTRGRQPLIRLDGAMTERRVPQRILTEARDGDTLRVALSKHGFVYESERPFAVVRPGEDRYVLEFIGRPR